MKYYIYISEDKIRMLYPQTRRGKVSKFLSKTDLHIQTPIGKVGIQEKTSIEDIIPQLEKTIFYLQQQDHIGSLDDPKEYIHGVIDLQSGIPIHGELSRLIIDVALWGNRYLPLVLVGSRKNLIGEN